jgi:uncharacterized protein (DUF1778 family)
MAQALLKERPSAKQKRPQPRQRKVSRAAADCVINLRTNTALRDMIDVAAESVGQNRTDFMLACARVRAQEVLLSRTTVVLSDAAWKKFQADLEAPPVPTAELVALMASTPPWA